MITRTMLLQLQFLQEVLEDYKNIRLSLGDGFVFAISFTSEENPEIDLHFSGFEHSEIIEFDTSKIQAMCYVDTKDNKILRYSVDQQSLIDLVNQADVQLPKFKIFEEE